MLEFNLIVKESEKKSPGFQADPNKETMLVALNPNLIVSVVVNRTHDDRTDIVCGAMTVVADERYESVLGRIQKFNNEHVYKTSEKDEWPGNCIDCGESGKTLRFTTAPCLCGECRKKREQTGQDY